MHGGSQENVHGLTFNDENVSDVTSQRLLTLHVCNVSLTARPTV